METKLIEIVEVFEQNKLRDFAFYECGFLHKTILPMLNEKQELFLLVNDDLTRNYKATDFIVSLDDIWHFLGYNQKARAKRVIEEHFILNQDYKIIVSNSHPIDKTIKCKQCRGGHNKEKIVMTIKTYKLFCLKSDTPMTYKMQEYYVALEQMVIKTLDDECNLFLDENGYDSKNMLDENGSVKIPECEFQNSGKKCDCGCDDENEESDLNISVEDHMDISSDEEIVSKFTKSLDDLIIQLTTNKSNLSKHLLKNYKENYHFIVIKNNIPKNSKIHGGHNKVTYMLTEFAYELLQNSFNLRNRYIVNMSENVKCINIGMCIENQTIGFIVNTFDSLVKTERQFIFGKYRVDLFFNDFKLIIECDENNHKDRCAIQEKIRENYLLSLGNTIIRFNPNDSKFELSNVLKEINKFVFFKSENNNQSVILLP